VTRTLAAQTGFPDLALCPEECAELVDRWSAVLVQTPRLQPWLQEMIRRQRTALQQQGSPHALIERALWYDLGRWVQQFEALPRFAVSAIATTLEEVERPPPPVEDAPLAAADSPERAVGEFESLLRDPAFALAFHCVEVRVRPALDTAHVPEPIWFGLLHAGARPQPLLTPAVAVMLVLRVLGNAWSALPGAARRAAIRLFQATAADFRAAGQLQRLCESLPPEWRLQAGGVPAFAASAARARSGMAEACALCARISASVAREGRMTHRGGLAVLQVEAAPAAAEELAELSETARKHNGMAGFRRLMALL